MRIRILMATAMLLVSFSLPAASRRSVPIVLDTDIGGDIDDAFALALVLASPELDLRAVTTVSGDTQARARIAARFLQAAGRPDVPVAAGDPGKPLDISQASWGVGFTSSSLTRTAAIDEMKAQIDGARGELVLVAIGPLTNIAALLRRYPDVKGKIKRIVLMGGSIARGYYPNSGPTAEYNIAADVAASQAVFSSGIPILMAPLDVTARLQVEPQQREQLFARHTPVIDSLHALHELWAQATPALQGIPTLHDPMAVSLLIDPTLCKTRAMVVDIGPDGMTRAPRVPGGEGPLLEPSAGRAPNAVVAVDADPSRFIRFYLRRLAP